MLRHFGVVLVAFLLPLGVGGCGGREDLPDNSRLLAAFAEGRTRVWVTGHGVVQRELGSDATFQRFLVRVGDDDLAVEIRHNIVQSRPIPVQRDDIVVFQGRYEFHGGGGEVWLTHADPAQPGGGGWIRHKGVIYD